MAYTIYNGDNRKDIVNQTKSRDYYEIYTYGGADEIKLTLEKTYVEAGKGNDFVRSNIEFKNDVFLGAGNDTYVGNGFTTNPNRFDLVSGGAGKDTFHISTSVSEYYGDGGNDSFYTVGYSNYLNGGNGRDMVSYMRQDNDSFLSGQGVRIDLFHNEAYTGASRYETLVNFEDAEGTSVGDTVIGDNGKNRLWGMDGNDIVDGRGGKDKLFGGNGNDDLYGGGKADKLIGGRGHDVMEGGAGGDIFIFKNANESATGSNRDEITDFSRSQGDQIDVSNMADFDYIGKSSFSGNGDAELRFNNETLSGDVDGDGNADFKVQVDDMNKLQQSDFIL